ncbi:MAG: DNA gyrase inhibitor YacG [Nitrospirae bacterium]|nr:DNA gyrase inhibitor YacG [Candidatus Manganitrophaceae bacterium]
MKALCPICKKTVEWEGNRHRPFCSERCKRVDLGQWASGTYRIPSPPEEETEPSGETDEEEGSSEGKNGRPGS